MIMMARRGDVDPVMAPVDKLPANAPRETVLAADVCAVVPFGMRLAVVPPGMGEHGKTYYTVTVNEPTTISKDGTQETITDSVSQERED